MRALYWNSQGLTKDGARAKLTELYHLHNPDIICIAKPHVFCNLRFVRSLKLVNFCEDVIRNEVYGEKGNLWVLWRNSLLRPDVLSSSRQTISLNVAGDFITDVHASCDPVARRRFWCQLGLGFISIPWLVLGDFNCNLRLDEKKGGRPIKEIYVNEFRSWISDNGLVEADAIGKKYTWSNCRSGNERIVYKHDRAVVNDDWLYKYENWRCKDLPRICSDHSPLFGYAFENPRPARALFRIHKMWLSHPNFMRLVEENWNLPLYGAPPFVFSAKLKRLKEALKVWNRTIFGEVQFRLKQAELKLESENDLLDLDPSIVLQFVKVADAKKAVEDDEIKDYIVNHYHAKFNGGEVNVDPRLFDIDHESISATESAFMDAILSLEEVKEAVFDLGADYAPGPDGFSGSFYRHCWKIISKDLYNAIANCWSMRKIPNGINSSFIVLIPKNCKSDAIKDYRPIGLSNFFFKIITKILATRLGKVLNKLISEEQVAFMKGRNIHENIALASELISEISTERKYGNVGLKLDIAQAFDTLSWEFIIEVFKQYGFSENWCSWILSILNSAWISVLINGSPEGFFSISRDKYLGIQLKPGIVRYIHVRKVMEKIMDKLAGWKGDAEKCKYFTVLYEDLCCSRREGGVGLKKLVDVNRVMLTKLWISIRDSNKIWARFLRAKYFKLNGNLIDYKLGSLVFPGIRLVYNFVQKHTRSIIGNDANISLFFDNWCGDFSIARRLGIFSKGPNDYKAKVSDIIVDGAWAIPSSLKDMMIRCNIDVDNMPLIAGGDDYKIWDLNSKGVFQSSLQRLLLKCQLKFCQLQHYLIDKLCTLL
ncbi:uncharacterized protein LOC113344004 [Papaver somniferum]|uniref:uncharacterized protein LOC113344004 n=1 Tax=Papaver somniferum TaxID=3469 RepID=UPI000E6F708D|nr:uncharacterized protein LOC113344004 [Papaver somniferum]